MFVRANYMDMYLKGMRDRSMRSGTDLAREIKLSDWSMTGNLSNRSSWVQILRDICTRLKRYLYSAKCSWIIILPLIIWLAPWAGMMNQIACCDWLSERARWLQDPRSHLACLALPALSHKQNVTKSHIINPLLTKFVRSRWLDIGLVLFLWVYGPRLHLGL